MYPIQKSPESLQRGDVFTGTVKSQQVEYTFVEWTGPRSSKFIVTRPGVEGFLQLRADFDRTYNVIRNELPVTDETDLTEGELFVAMIELRATLWRFVSKETKRGKVQLVCINPVNGRRSTIAAGDFQILKLNRVLANNSTS